MGTLEGEGDGVTVDTTDVDAFMVTCAVVDAIVGVALAAWSLLVVEVHPATNNAATTASTVMANHSFVI